MDKQALLNWLSDEYQQWQDLIDSIGLARMSRPGVIGEWSMTDLIAHLTGWQRRFNARLAAMEKGEPLPPPPWPVDLETEDEINGWIIESNQGRPAPDVVDDSYRILQALIALVERLPDDSRIEQVHHEGRIYHLFWVGDERFQAGEFFDHYHDDHESDVRAWLEQTAAS